MFGQLEHIIGVACFGRFVETIIEFVFRAEILSSTVAAVDIGVMVDNCIP